MGYPTGVEWTDATWNPVAGCSRVGPGCDNCYAQQLAATQQTAHQIKLYLGITSWVRGRPVFNGRMTALEPGHDGLTWPLRWRGADHPKLGPGRRSLVWVVDMGDLFHERRAWKDINRAVETIALSDHIGQLLTKRSDRMPEFFAGERPQYWRDKLWLGFSGERQVEFDQRWSNMRQLAAGGWITFVSIAPMLAPVVLPPDFLRLRNRVWVICSGEQGVGGIPPRYMDPDWARFLRDQCVMAGVPFFMKQMSAKKPIPPDLLIRQFPAVESTKIEKVS